MNLFHKIFLSIIFVLVAKVSNTIAAEPPFLKFMNDSWVNSQLENMSLEDKIAQLMMITVYPKQNEDSKKNIIEQIETWKPGGIIVMQGSPVKTTSWINEFQEKSKTPLLVAIDAEWGLTMRIDSTIRYPNAQAVGAVQDSTFIYQMGRDFGNQLKQMGIHINFAP
ncbi:MAG: hypothetical protein HOG79_00500, partial [Prolixibacteraceae bacterium]|nr:hypothetical protein [Prolixibacteraceae bacterium]